MKHKSEPKPVFQEKYIWQITAVAFVLLGLRLIIFHRYYFSFLVWNLFLGLVPFWLAKYFQILSQQNSWPRFFKKILLVLTAFLWLIFLPNAPYLVTDLIYLQYSSQFSFVLDLAMLGSFAMLGFLLGILSLELMKHEIGRIFGEKVKFPLMVAVSLLSGFAIYLGRFVRWNSWDIMTHPLGLIYNIFQLLITPLQHPEMIATTLCFAAAMIAGSDLFEKYFTIKSHT